MTYTFQGERSTWSCDKIDLVKFCQEIFEQPPNEAIMELPPNWKDLEWWGCDEDPCLCGDDVLVALEYDRVHIIFDGWCSTRHRPYGRTEEQVLHAVCTDNECGTWETIYYDRSQAS